jgi:hypothetical protein
MEMKAKVGDWLVMKGLTINHAEHRGLITALRSEDGSPPYVVRWLVDDHVAIVFPGPDAVIVTAEEQREADERARQRMSSNQSGVILSHRVS